MFPDFRCFKSSRKTTSCRLFRPHVSGRGGILLYTFYIVLQQALQRRVELQFFDHCLSMFYRSLPWFHAHQPAFYWILNLKFNRLSSFKRPWSKQWQQTIATAKGQQSGLAFPYMDATWCDAKNCRVQPPKEQDLKTHDLQRSSTLGLGLPNNGYQHCCFPHSQILQTHPILADLWWYYLVEDYSPTQFQHIKHQTSPWPRDLGRFFVDVSWFLDIAVGHEHVLTQSWPIRPIPEWSGPVVSSSRLAEDEVVRTEELAERPGADAVHGTWSSLKTHGVLVTGLRFAA